MVEGEADMQTALDGILREVAEGSAAPGIDSSAVEPVALVKGDVISHMGSVALEMKGYVRRDIA